MLVFKINRSDPYYNHIGVSELSDRKWLREKLVNKDDLYEIIAMFVPDLAVSFPSFGLRIAPLRGMKDPLRLWRLVPWAMCTLWLIITLSRLSSLSYKHM